MATITLNIPPADEAWLFDGITLRYGYPSSVVNPSFDASLGIDPSTNPENIPNPQSIEDFTKEKAIGFLKNEATQGYVKLEWENRRTEQDSLNIT